MSSFDEYVENTIGSPSSADELRTIARALFEDHKKLVKIEQITHQWWYAETRQTAGELMHEIRQTIRNKQNTK